VRSQPDLHVRLYADSVKDLKAFMEGAQGDRTEAGGDQGMPAYESMITFDTPVETGKLFSLARSDYEFTGGAHGNTAYTGVLWDKAMKRAVAASGPAQAGRGYVGPGHRLLCTAINAEKRKRDPQAETVSLNPKGRRCGAAPTPPTRPSSWPRHRAGQGGRAGLPDRPLSGRPLCRRRLSGPGAAGRDPQPAGPRLCRRVRRRAGDAGDVTPS
jgi:hypothetical protein